MKSLTILTSLLFLFLSSSSFSQELNKIEIQYCPKDSGYRYCLSENAPFMVATYSESGNPIGFQTQFSATQIDISSLNETDRENLVLGVQVDENNQINKKVTFHQRKYRSFYVDQDLIIHKNANQMKPVYGSPFINIIAYRDNENKEIVNGNNVNINIESKSGIKMDVSISPDGSFLVKRVPREPLKITLSLKSGADKKEHIIYPFFRSSSPNEILYKVSNVFGKAK